MTQADFRQCRSFVRGANQLHALLRDGTINGFAVGRKVVGGRATDDLAITVFVARKLPLGRLPLARRIPQVLRLPDETSPDGTLDFLTDVQQASFRALAYTGRERPAPSGISIGHTGVSAGTLGGLLRDKDSGAAVILSNNHVLAASNQAAAGDAILQPGPADGGSDPGDRIATLTRFVEIDFSAGGTNQVDGAIATPIAPAGEQALWHTRDLGPETPARKRALGETDLGLEVWKTGRTTEHTEGFVHSLFAAVRVSYGAAGSAVFVDQVIASQPEGAPPFSAGGDSGSLVYDRQRRCLGLLFAGDEGAAGTPATTIVNPIDLVLRALRLGFLKPGEFPAAAPG